MANLSCPRSWPPGEGFLSISNVILSYTDRLTLPTSPKVLYATSGLASGILSDTNQRHLHESKPSWGRSVNPSLRLGWMEQENLNGEQSLAEDVVAQCLGKGAGEWGSPERHAEVGGKPQKVLSLACESVQMKSAFNSDATSLPSNCRALKRRLD